MMVFRHEPNNGIMEGEWIWNQRFKSVFHRPEIDDLENQSISPNQIFCNNDDGDDDDDDDNDIHFIWFLR